VVGLGDRLALWRLTSPDGHLEGVDDELGAHVIADGPPHHHPAERLKDDSQVELAVAGGVLGDIHHP
jgi:hypothetical protein